MDYLSVKNAAVKFELSERRIQKLCETGRIAGCQMISGVWLIPNDAKKPSDDRLAEFPDKENCASLKELCKELSISTATGRNWLKLGKLTAQYTDKGIPYFTREDILTLKKNITSGKNTALKSRRNKKYVSGNALYRAYVSNECKNVDILQKLLEIFAKEEILLTDDVIGYIIADCALHLFLPKTKQSIKEKTNLLLRYLEGELDWGKYDPLIDSFMENRNSAMDFCKKHSRLFHLEYLYEPGEDILGLLYISCKNIGARKATGSYYTPTKVVRKLISKLKIESTHRVLDPCCGTGNFLLQLPESASFENVYGNDTDSVSVKIARLNMALKYPTADIQRICEHITESDYLTEYHKGLFHHIIGNPPWGYDFSASEAENLKVLYKTASGKNIESYDVFIEHALECLTCDGQLSFVLPEAVLNVKAHMTIRSIILKTTSIKYLEFLGNAFDGVQCPCIILQLAFTQMPLSTNGMTINDRGRTFEIHTERAVDSGYFSFMTTDPEYHVLEKIKKIDHAAFLAGNADFALGIVTGNNKEYLSSQKTDTNEIVLKGSDIRKYFIRQADSYITFQPEKFQQAAPAAMYRAPEKLLYRFICSQLVFAYDDRQTLSLNSCNIVIPRFQDIKIKYVLAILNSRIAQFLYKKEFNSVKVLRSHIECIPIPVAEEDTQDKLISITECLIKGQDAAHAAKLYDELDDMVSALFHLSDTEKKIIKEAVDGENSFLT